jgi:NitT/TauT family transport system ATP-binding protein
MIRIDVRRKAFGATEVLRDVRLDMATGERVAVVGPSGVGKSTLLRIVAGIDRAYEGSVERPEKIAIVFQEPTLLRWRSVLQNLTLTNPHVPAGEASAMLARVGLAGKADDFPGQLSLGQQRRVALARAFVGMPELLILDEPFVSLDAELAEEMMALTEGLIEETHPSVMLVTHMESEARRLGDRIVRLQGAPATIV